MDNHQKFMSLALKLAKKAYPSPNPRVGAVIVKNGRVIGNGYHKKYGETHAEVIAINSVSNKDELKGATLYVTLEPCSHHDKTPPCTGTIIESGINEVIIGCEDENPKIDGILILREKGLKVEVIDDERCKKLNEAFFHWIKKQTPFVLLKLAMTLDGRIATKTGDSKYISNAQSRALSNSLRSDFDAIMVGINTVLIDNPRLTSRKPGSRNPTRIIVDSYLKAPLGYNWIEPNAVRIIATTDKHDKEKRKKLEAEGVEIIVLPETTEGHVDMNVLLQKLGSTTIAKSARVPLSCTGELPTGLGEYFSNEPDTLRKRMVPSISEFSSKNLITSILVEGGSELATTMLEAGLINKVLFFISGQILGNGINAFQGKGVERMKDALRLKNIAIRKIQEDVLIEGYL